MIPAEVLEHRWLLYNFFTREIRGRYIGSLSGLFWALLHPLLLLAIYAFVFAVIFRVRLPGVSDAGAFTGFVAVALWPWLALQESVQRGAMAVRGNADLLKKAAFPQEILVYASVAATFAIHAAGYLAVLLLVHVFIMPLHLAWLPWVAAWLVLLLLFAIGLAFVFASLQVFFPDVEHFLPPFFMVFFYATPVLYSVAMVPEAFRPVLGLNPVAHFVERLRELLIGGGDWLRATDLYLLAGGVLVFLAGRWLFRRLSPYFEDFL